MTSRADRRHRAAIVQARLHPVAWILRHVAARLQTQSVQAPARLWLDFLNHHADEQARASRDWPKSEEQLARTLGELKPGLARLGVIISAHRCRFLGAPRRVWRLETSATRRHRELNPSKGRKGYKGAALPFSVQETATLGQILAAEAESRRKRAAHTGAPKMGRIKRKTTVEECARVRPEEAAHVGAQTEETAVADSSARRLWCLCECGARVVFLYQLPEGGAWKCRTCHDLTTRQRQRRGTRAEFEAWLTPARYSEMSHKHPALNALYEAMATDWRENVAPYDCPKLTHARRAELLKSYKNAQIVREVFDSQRHAWSARAGELGAATGAKIEADLWTWWKSRNRSKPKKPEQNAPASP